MKCPICSSKQTAFFAAKDSYRFFRCASCKTIFLPRLPSDSELNTYYAQTFSYTDGLLNETIIRKRSAEILPTVKKLAPKAITMCDVGSGYGFFLDEAKQQGYEVLGIEPSKHLAEHAKKKYYIDSFVGNLQTYIKKHKNQFDVVTCIHVIEHVRNPKQFIAQLLTLVKPRGLLYLETPNSDSHLLYAEKQDYTFLIPPDHLWLFSRFSIRKMLPKKTEILLTKTYSYSEHLMGIVKQIMGRHERTNENTNNKSNNKTNNQPSRVKQKKNWSYYLFDRLLAPLFTGMLNQYHKGSILELYIRKKEGKCGL